MRPRTHRSRAGAVAALTGLIALAVGLALATPAAAVPRDVLARLRAECGPGAPALVRAPALDGAARRMADGASLRDALARAGYRADEAVSIHVQGEGDDAALGRVLRARYCGDVGNPAVRQFGLAQRSRDLWLVLAAPFAPPAPADAARVADRMLELVNGARAQARRCGRERFAPVKPLRADATLDAAARRHARAMAATGAFDHVGRDGSTPMQRVRDAGYAPTMVAENIAAGATTPEEAVRGWLDSPGHCANLMHPRAAEMGIAYAVEPKSPAGIYWVQVFAAPAARPSGAPRASRSGSGAPSAKNSSDTELMQ